MFGSLARLVLVAAFALGIWKFYPRLKPAIQPILANPKVFGVEIIGPAIRTINEILPDNIQIPSPRQSDSEGGSTSNGQISGATTSSPNSPNNTNLTNIINNVVNEVKQQAGEIAQDQIDAAKKEAGKAFCQVLIEKVKTECNL